MMTGESNSTTSPSTNGSSNSKHVDPNGGILARQLQEENEWLKRRTAILEKKLSLLQNSNNNSTRAKEEEQQSNEALQEELMAMKKKVQTYEALIDSHFRELPQLRMDLAVAQKQVSDKANEMTVLEQSLEGKTADFEELKEENVSLQKMLSVAKREQERANFLEAELERMRATSGDEKGLRDTLHTKMSLISELERQVHSLTDAENEHKERQQRMYEEIGTRCSKWQQAQSRLKLSKVEAVHGLAAVQQMENVRSEIEKIRQTCSREKRDEKIAEHLLEASELFKIATDWATYACELQQKVNELIFNNATAGSTGGGASPQGAASGGPSSGGSSGAAPAGYGGSTGAIPATPRGGWMSLNRGST